MSETELVLDDVCVSLDRPLFRISETVRSGEILTVMGPSGAGKSSLLAFIAGHLDPVFTASGDVRVDGRSITGLPAYRRRVGMLFQDPLLFPHLSVAGNLLFGLAAGGRKSARMARVRDALVSVELDGAEDRDPESLSGGEKARVSLMRTILSEPDILLLDEPFSKLDAGLRHSVRSMVFAHAKARGLPVIMVTHDPDDASAAGGRVVTL